MYATKNISRTSAITRRFSKFQFIDCNLEPGRDIISAVLLRTWNPLFWDTVQVCKASPQSYNFQKVCGPLLSGNLPMAGHITSLVTILELTWAGLSLSYLGGNLFQYVCLSSTDQYVLMRFYNNEEQWDGCEWCLEFLVLYCDEKHYLRQTEFFLWANFSKRPAENELLHCRL